MMPTTGTAPTTTSQATLEAGTRFGLSRIRAMTTRVRTMLISWIVEDGGHVGNLIGK